MTRVIGEEIFHRISFLQIQERVSIVAVPGGGHGDIELAAVVDPVMQVGEGRAVDVEEQVVAGLLQAAHAVADDDGSGRRRDDGDGAAGRFATVSCCGRHGDGAGCETGHTAVCINGGDACV
ncbi:hypothetical protein D3C81_404450 [compost metagenome]